MKTRVSKGFAWVNSDKAYILKTMNPVYKEVFEYVVETDHQAQFYIQNLWRWSCGIPEKTIEKVAPLEELKVTEWSEEFEKLMRNRLIMGAIRYGRLKAKNKVKYDRISSIIKRLKDYENTGNKEKLVDVANLCLLEFEECDHPKAHFNAEDDKEHVKSI